MKSNRSLISILQQYQKTHDLAVRMYGLFEEADAKELLAVQETLGENATTLVEMAGLDWEGCGSLGRHLHFLEYYLSRNEKDSCSSDIRDIFTSVRFRNRINSIGYRLRSDLDLVDLS